MRSSATPSPSPATNETRLGSSQAQQPGFSNVLADWDVDRLSKNWDVLDCKHITPEFVLSGMPVVSIREVQSRFVDVSEAKETTNAFYARLIEGGRKPRPGDLILSRNATVGEVAQVAEWHPPFAMGQDVCLLRKRSPSSSSQFLQSVFRSEIVSRQLANLMVGSTFRRVNVRQIKALIVPFPSEPEQQAIADALSDVDGLLETLDVLIAKRRAIKLAAMQQLLTGKTRLPGFSGEWQTKRLGDIVHKFRGGGTPSRANPAYWGNEIPWMTVKDFATFNPRGTQEGITRVGLAYSASTLIAARTLIIATRMALGRAVFYEVDVAINQDLKGLILKPGTDVLFLRFWFEFFGGLIDEMGGGSTVKGVSVRALSGLAFHGPSEAEQVAVAAVLGDMDAEIAALEARRDKTQDIKQGMMQQLLTGRVRLMKPASGEASA